MTDYDLFFRNPNNYIKELLEVGKPKFAWDRGILSKRKIDPIKFSQAYLDTITPWEALCIGSQGTVHYNQDCTTDTPLGVYPTWEAAEDPDNLMEVIYNPWGENEEYCSDLSIPTDQRPVWGQKHMVVVTSIPVTNSGAGKSVVVLLKQAQEDNPDVTIYIHGLYSYRTMYGHNFKAGDTDPRTEAGKGNVYLANGKKITGKEMMLKYSKHIRPHGYSVKDLEVPRNRCMFNIRTAMHASKFWHTEMVPPTVARRDAPVDTDTPEVAYTPPSLSAAQGRPKMPAKPGDKIQCDTCSLQAQCAFYREGSVCTLPESEVRKLSEFFDTRDSGVLLQGLQSLLVRQADRLEKSANIEDFLGEHDPEVDKQANKLFDNTVKFAKLVDPSLTKPAVQINMGETAAVGTSSAKEMAQKALKELMDAGWTPKEITPDVLKAHMSGDPVHRAIEGEVVRDD